MNLKQGNGKVPIATGDPESPYKLIPFPDRETFDRWLHRAADKEKYWKVLTKRASGASLSECGSEYGITKERVRQIEAKFLRQARLFSRTD
jgi:DNA-directed RNA polymerase sigma subunit (sigma70/sigma32)